MNPPGRNKPHILFLYSDTGGGHRAAAEAIIEAINLEFPGQVTTEMVDIFLRYAPPPINLAPRIYPRLSRMPNVWEMGYRASDGRRRTRFAYRMLWPYVRRGLQRLMVNHPASLIVSVHQMINTPVSRIAHAHQVPFMTVVTDLVSTHAAWYCPTADLVIVPTQAAYDRGLAMHMPAGRMQVVGQPVADRFCLPPGDRVALRKKLGWQPDLTTAVLVGGGEGMGPTALAEAAQQDLIICFQEGHAHGVPPLPQDHQDVLQGPEELALPHVDDEGHPIDPLFRVGAEIRDRGDQGGGQIVDAEDADVFQGLDRLALPGSRHPRDNDALHRFAADGSQ